MVIGGSSIVTIALGFVRTKAIALLIGTEGMGLFGALNSVTTLVGGIAGMGISTSGVRQIAEAVGSGDQLRVTRTVLVLRRTAVILGSVGMLAMLVLSKPISIATFATPDYAGAIALLSVAVFFMAISEGQTALIQGLRRITDLAALKIIGAVLATALSIPFLFYFGLNGVVPFLITVAALTIATSWWFARKIKLKAAPIASGTMADEGKKLLVMGFAFMASGLMSSGVAYLTRVMIIRQMNLDAAGLFQAASSISTVYVGFILTAMGAEYYPRLTAVADKHEELNRQVNMQTESALLMALPGILATLAFAPWVISILYSAEFLAAGEILRWQILGILGRVVVWPVGYVLLAKGNARAFIAVEIISNTIHLGFLWLGIRWFGLPGLGMAFAGLYVVSGIFLLALVNRLTGFVWTRGNLKLIAGAVTATLIVFVSTTAKNFEGWALVICGVITIASTVYAISHLCQRMGYRSFAEAWAAGCLKMRKKLS